MNIFFEIDHHTQYKKSNGGITMNNLSEKELSFLDDSLNEEQLLVKKFQMLADQASDVEVKEKFTRIANQHQGHFNELYSLLG